ncbi:cadherin-AgCad1-like isoform X3 [Chironomus tepperi]|uniref:cadherin-AgCad1-like isoform X3 n=1 Tax=Chironomus tepperi TaxID=113505 RepID=UPI00391F3162
MILSRTKMAPDKRLSLLVFLFLVKFACSDWASPFLITEREDVTIELKFDDFVSITMNEEIISPFTVAYLNEYSGNDSPIIMPFSLGQSIDLGLKFEKNNTRWDMIVTKTQDYENAANRKYIFDLKVGLVLVTVDITIKNIFDNPPSVSYENPCIVPELTDPNYVSECSYKVTDIDGMLNNTIRFEVQGNFNESEIFDFSINSSLSGDYSQTYSLLLKQTLYYDMRFFYSFRVTVYDIGNNQFSFNIIVEVQDMPNKPPMWIRVFASAQFFEKEAQEFQAVAIDGDTGINDPICYTIEFDEDKDFSNLISIEEATGIIHVLPIDRDSLKMEVFPFHIKAYECKNESSWISNPAVLLVEDLNDNIPLVYFNDSKNVIEMYEETFYTLFDTNELTIIDADLGMNAMYNVRLEREKFASAFNIIPQNGYQEQSFTISVLNQNLLDFEVPEFQSFDITIVATEAYNISHSSEKVFHVNLLNWNDELPEFEANEYIFSINETAGSNYTIGFVKANDRDIGDEIEYYLNEKVGEKIHIDMKSGQLTTILNKTFDYEQQPVFTFQVFAKDKLQTRNEPTHTTSTQIQINVIDVNDTPPTIILPRKFLTVTENELDALITDEIEVYDPDTSANLKIFIDWSQSIASGLDVLEEDYENCVEISGELLNSNQLKGTLKSSLTKIIDYEKFQVLFLTITAVDLNTEVNDNSTSAVLTVFVLDVNDNAPEFVGNTLEVKRSVIEQSESDMFIGFLNAIDRDGPGNNDITFTLIPNDNATTEWVKIESKSGELSVGMNKVIDCDIPKRLNLDYAVKISDGELESIGQISIAIIDINDRIPESEEVEDVIKIFENSSDILLKTIKAFDLDRDEPHNVVQYTINYQSNFELQRYFTINLTSGELRVKVLDDYNVLDRDTEPSNYSIPIYIEDNLGIGARNVIQRIVHVILLDVNDNAPQMPQNLDGLIPMNEDIKKSTTILERFYAPDIDEGLNAEVLYEILSLEPTVDRNISQFESLFELENYDFKYCRIKTRIDLKGFSGTWSLKIRAVDRGNETEGGYSQSSKSSYEIKIDPLNYNYPVIKFPSKDNNIIRLDYGASEIGKTLVFLNGSKIPPFEAFDDDAGIFGDVDFSIESDPQNVFEFKKIDRRYSELHLKSAVEEKVYEITVMAFDGGNWRSDSLSISFAFVDKTSEPYFENNEWITIFTENQTGLEEFRIIPEAIDPKNFGIQNGELEFDVFYYLDDSYRPDDAQFFALNSSTRVLTLTKMLDREIIDYHSIRIIVSNENTMPAIRFVSDKAMLYIKIDVEDVNDNPPSFIYPQYAVGISERDNLGKNLISLEATDPDLNDVITYRLLKDTIEVSNEDLNNLKDSAFLVNSVTGNLLLNFEVQSTMSGFFTFQVEACDLANHTDTANVKIYIVADLNRVTFTFRNTVDEVKAVDQLLLAQIFSDAYKADCIIDDILPYQTSTGIVDDKETNFRVHFVKDNEAISAEDIEQRSSDIQFITELVSTLNTRLALTLKGLPTYNANIPEKVDSKLLEIILAIVSGVLCILLIALITLYTIQRKSFNRQIKALSQQNNDFDYQQFKNVKALPNTNMYAGTSGSQINPVLINDFKDTKDFETKSIDSRDSDDFADLSNNQIFNISSKLNGTTKA